MVLGENMVSFGWKMEAFWASAGMVLGTVCNEIRGNLGTSLGN